MPPVARMPHLAINGEEIIVLLKVFCWYGTLFITIEEMKKSFEISVKIIVTRKDRSRNKNVIYVDADEASSYRWKCEPSDKIENCPFMPPLI